MNQLWSLLNGMSNLMFLSLVSIRVPSLTSSVTQSLLQFINLDLLVTSQWLDPWLAKFSDGTEESTFPQGLNMYFYNNGITSLNFFRNLQSSLVYFEILFFAHLLYPLFSLIGDCSPFFKKHVTDRIARHLYWSGSLRFFI